MTCRAYYNENDPRAAAWLRALIADGWIAYGDVDERSIAEVCGADLRGYAQVHLFAGIGGWSRALRLAHWADAAPVWTGSCPCQPFSVAGRRQGAADPRHVWPHFRRLVRECGPAIVFGEQVASPAGRAWLSGVRADLEALGYAFGSADLCAAGVAAPHIRQRLYWLAHSDVAQCEVWSAAKARPRELVHASDGGEAGRLDDSCGARLSPPEREELRSVRRGHQGRAARESGGAFWATCDVVHCRDGKARRIEPGSFPLADGVPGRVGLLRGYGNAIVPPLAAEFIRAAREALTLTGTEQPDSVTP